MDVPPTIPIDTKAVAGEPRIAGDPPASDSDFSEKRDSYSYAEEPVSTRHRTQGGTFVDTDINGARWRPLDSYEGAHRFDPDFEWDQAEERRLVRKVVATKDYVSTKTHNCRLIGGSVPLSA